jgi:hypothetical protein
MTIRLADIAACEAQLAEISDKLSEASLHRSRNGAPEQGLMLDPEFLEAAKLMLAALTRNGHVLQHDALPVPAEDIDSYLDFDPAFADAARAMLQEFIRRTEATRE